MKKIKIMFLGVISMLPFAANAAGMDDGPVWYLEGNVGRVHVGDANFADNTSLDTSGTAWNINIGYRIIPYFALEGGYTNYPDSIINYNTQEIGKNEQSSYDLAAKAIIPFMESGLSVFGKVGIAWVRSDVKATDQALIDANNITLSTGHSSSSALLYGFGAEYAVWSNVAANLQWSRIDGDDQVGNIDSYFVGISYTFG